MMRIARAIDEAHTAERRIGEAEYHMSRSGDYELPPGDPVQIEITHPKVYQTERQSSLLQNFTLPFAPDSE
jgi:hypothetical protein